MLTDLIARAWEQERAKCVILWDRENETFSVFCAIDQQNEPPLYRPAWMPKDESREACQAHLNALCAAAVERAIADAGMVVVPAEPTEAQKAVCYDWAEDTDGIARNEKFYRAMIAAG